MRDVPQVGREADRAGRDSQRWASLWLLEPRSRSRCTRSGSGPSGRAVSTTRRSSVQIFVSDTERTRSWCVCGRLYRSSTSNPGALGNFRRRAEAGCRAYWVAHSSCAPACVTHPLLACNGLRLPGRDGHRILSSAGSDAGAFYVISRRELTMIVRGSSLKRSAPHIGRYHRRRCEADSIDALTLPYVGRGRALIVSTADKKYHSFAHQGEGK